MQPLISVIIPVHNGEKFIENLLGKLLSNSYENLEICVGNDASSDKTELILKKFQAIPNVKIFSSTENIGAGAMRNKLISLASGELIALQDIDDSFQEDRFYKQAVVLLRSDIDVVGSQASLISSDKIWGIISPPEKPKWINWFKQNSVVHASVMFKKKLLNNKTFYAEGMRFGEDYYFLTKLYCNGAKFLNISEPLYEYHISKDELKSRSKKYFTLLIKSKIKISEVLPWYIKPLFISFHISKLTFAWLLLYIKGNHEKNKNC